jgi:putative endonuclease
MSKQWVLYILECKDGTLYTGITDDLERRLAVHGTAKGAKYTRGRGPFILRYTESCEDHSHALRRELQVKSLSRQQKLELFN